MTPPILDPTPTGPAKKSLRVQFESAWLSATTREQREQLLVDYLCQALDLGEGCREALEALKDSSALAHDELVKAMIDLGRKVDSGQLNFTTELTKLITSLEAYKGEVAQERRALLAELDKQQAVEADLKAKLMALDSRSSATNETLSSAINDLGTVQSKITALTVVKAATGAGGFLVLSEIARGLMHWLLTWLSHWS